MAVNADGDDFPNLVRPATAKASELSAVELREGGDRLLDLVAERRPIVVAIAGITAYRHAFGRRGVTLGRQSQARAAGRSDTALWVVPNPGGLNAHETIASLAAAYAAPAAEAGVIGR